MCDATPSEWGPEQEALFLRMYRHVLLNQVAFAHPDADPIPADHWGTLAWNLSWAAALFMDPETPLLRHVDEDGTVLGEELDTARPQ